MNSHKPIRCLWNSFLLNFFSVTNFYEAVSVLFVVKKRFSGKGPHKLYKKNLVSKFTRF